MAYVKPGVEVTQVQSTASPILTAPTLQATVIGKGYFWQDPYEDEAVVTTSYSGLSMSIDISDFGRGYDNIQTNDDDLVIIDIQSTAGANVGQTLHLGASDFSVTTGSGASLTISGALSVGGTSISKGTVRVGYRAVKPDSEGWKVLDSLSTIESELGKVVSWNPLAYGASIMQANSSSVVTSYGNDDVDGGDTLANLGLHETYALAFLDDDADAVAVKAHCETYSNAIYKKERVAFVNKAIAWNNGTWGLTATKKADTSADIRDANAGIGSKRVFSVHPDIAYVRETRHISSLHPDFVQASFKDQFAGTFTDYNAYCQLVSKVTLADGTVYGAGTDVDSTVSEALRTDGGFTTLEV